jgi:hypothetical protein
VILAVSWSAILIGCGALLSGAGAFLSGMAALRLAGKKAEEAAHEVAVEGHGADGDGADAGG